MVTETARRKRKSDSQKWHWLRRAVQVVALLAFLYLLLDTRQGSASSGIHAVFFNLDPLAGITSMLASRSWIPLTAFGAITLVLTLAVGRAWCGWLCPLGTILYLTPSRHTGQSTCVSRKWRQVKYFLIFATLIAAALGSLTLLILDPITLLFRTLASAILPGLSVLVRGAESLLYGVGLLRPAVEWFDGAFRGWLLTDQPFYLPNILLLLLFALVLALNAARERFWCRYLCPLGGLLGLVSKVTWLRYRVNDEKCIACGKCSKLCPTGAIDPDNNFVAGMSECTLCLDCMENCPTQAISFNQQRLPEHGYSESRRQFLASAGAAAVGAALLRFVPTFARSERLFIRPPGSSEEGLFSQCIRCGSCMRVCPTGVIQPSSPLGDQAKLWTPALMTRLGYCDYSCNACGQVCPTGAIASLALEEKRRRVIGVAVIDRTTCIPWAEGRDCIVCEEMCPIPEKAIKLGQGGRGHGSGRGRHPRVIEELCNGCGICEYQCPVAGESAIRIVPPVRG